MFSTLVVELYFSIHEYNITQIDGNIECWRVFFLLLSAVGIHLCDLRFHHGAKMRKDVHLCHATSALAGARTHDLEIQLDVADL